MMKCYIPSKFETSENFAWLAQLTTLLSSLEAGSTAVFSKATVKLFGGFANTVTC